MIHAIIIPISFICLIIYFWVTLGLPPIREDPFVIFSMPLDLIMLLSGTLVGIFQISTGRLAELTDNFRKKLLWILSSTFGWGIDFWAALYSTNFGANTLTQSLFCGLGIGFISGGILILLLREANPV